MTSGDRARRRGKPCKHCKHRASRICEKKVPFCKNSGTLPEIAVTIANKDSCLSRNGAGQTWDKRDSGTRLFHLEFAVLLNGTIFARNWAI